MDAQERTMQVKRISKFNQLEEAAGEIRNHLRMIAGSLDDKPTNYTMNTSQVRDVHFVSIGFGNSTDTLRFYNSVLRGYEIGNALSHILNEKLKAIYKEMEKI